MEKLLKEIKNRFKLNEYEFDILKQYINHLHEESRESFVKKVLISDRSYIEKFLDTDLDNFETDFFKEEKDENRDHSDLYFMRRENDLTKNLLIYQALIKKISLLEKEERNTVYKKFGFDIEKLKDKSKLEKRSIFYELYKNFINNLRQSQFEKFIENLFSSEKDILNLCNFRFFDIKGNEISFQRNDQKRLYGKVRIGRIYYKNNKKIFPSFKNYSKIIVLTKTSEYGELGPYVLKDENGRIFENIWQFSKVYKWVPKVEMPYTDIDRRIAWKWKEEIHVDKTEPNEKYWKWRKTGQSNPFPVRYPVGQQHRKNCLYCLKEKNEKHLTYIQARKEIYLKEYCKLVKRQNKFIELRKRLENGENLLILETDGPHQESLEYYKEKYKISEKFIINHTIKGTIDNLKVMINDETHSFGHGYCLAAALLDIDNLI